VADSLDEAKAAFRAAWERGIDGAPAERWSLRASAFGASKINNEN
jgi:hypothetical protein